MAVGAIPKPAPSPVPDKKPGTPGTKPGSGPAPGMPGGPPIPGYGYYPVFPTTNAYGQPAEIIVDAGSKLSGKKGNRGKKSEERQAQVAGAGKMLPLLYGEQRLGGGIIAWGFLSGKLVVAVAWCEGEIEGVQSYTINDEAAPTGTVATHYTGSQTQNADPTLVAMRAAQGSAFTDSYRGTAYSVFQVPPSKVSGFPRFNAIIRGLKVATTEGGARTYSEVPAYIIADFVETWMTESIDWTSVAALATRNMEMIGSPAEARNLLSLSMDQQQLADVWLDILCDYAGCWWVRDNGEIKLIPDVPAASEFTVTAANVVRDTAMIEQRDSTKSPTVIQVTWTDRSQLPWRDETYTAYAPGVLAGTTERRVSKIRLPGITRHSEARRYAIQRLNEFLTSDLSFAAVLFDESIAMLPGTRITVTHPLGLTAKEMRVKSASLQGPGRWAIAADEYDETKYSDDVVAGSSTPDTTLPSMLDVPAIVGFAVQEEIAQLQTGRWVSRLILTWTTPTRTTYPYLKDFDIQVINGDNVQSFNAPYDATTFTTPPLPENFNYEVRIRARSELEEGAWSTLFITNDGKLALPSDVPAFSGYSVNGETRLFWEAANDRDPTSYEIRYSDEVTDDWDTATFLAFVAWPALSYTSTVVPPGSKRFYIKLHDSVITALTPNGQESLNPTKIVFVVVPSTTSESTETALTLDSLTNMIEMMDGSWVTSIPADNFAAQFPNPLDTYTDPLATYHASGTSGLVTDAVDYGEVLTPSALQATMSYTDISGTGRIYIEHKQNIGDAWTSVDGNSIAGVALRYARVGIEWTGTETGQVHNLGVLRLNLDATDRFIKDTILNDATAWMMTD